MATFTPGHLLNPVFSILWIHEMVRNSDKFRKLKKGTFSHGNNKIEFCGRYLLLHKVKKRLGVVLETHYEGFEIVASLDLTMLPKLGRVAAVIFFFFFFNEKP